MDVIPLKTGEFEITRLGIVKRHRQRVGNIRVSVAFDLTFENELAARQAGIERARGMIDRGLA